MRFFILLFLFFCATSARVYSPEQSTYFRTILADCQKTTRTERKMVIELIDRQVPDEDKLKDFLFCAFKRMALFDEHDFVNEEALKNVADSLAYPANTVMNACINRRELNGREASYYITKCYLENLPNNADVMIDF